MVTPGWRAPSREARDTLFMLALIGWTILPHLGHLPAWVGLLAFGVLAWRGWLAWRQGPLPGRWTVLGLLGIAAVLTFAGQKTLIGKEAGVTLLVVLMALKTLELRARRDALVVFFLGFFLVLTTFLYSQSLPVAVGTGLAVWGWLTALTLAHIPAGRPTIRQAAALAGRAALVGTPVMVALFLLFPRIGPLWNSPNGGAATGLSDHIELGTVAELANDESIAFRLRFDGPVPPQDRLYFRGPVLSETDGREWHVSSFPALRLRAAAGLPATSYSTRGRPVRYEMTLEPTQATWLPLLELVPPAGASTDDGSAADKGLEVLDGSDVLPVPDVDGQWRTRRPIAQRVRLRASSWPDDRITGAAPEELQVDLRLPRAAHPRIRAWARDWLAAQALPAVDGAPDPDAIVAALYRRIGSAGYSYTLAPGAYEGDAIDEFWLDRKSGFCEHYATAFVVVLRALGVPARVVTGYQGADAAPTDGYVIVRQSNAHAWAEYWHPRHGWTRADPTAAVAPDRIERGRTLRPRPGFIGGAFNAMTPGLLEHLRAWRETLDNRWNQWVLGYNGRKQLDLMKSAGFASPDAEDLGHVLIGLIVLASLAGAGATWWDAHRLTPGQRLARRLRRALRPLARQGLAPAPHESPGIVAAALRRRFGAAAEALAARLDALERGRYGPPGAGPADAAAWRAIRDAAKALAAGNPTLHSAR